MKSAIHDSSTDSVRIVDRPVPEIGKGEILLRPRSVGLCASELIPGHLRKGGSLGHEVAGVVHRVGPEVENLREGDRVFIHHHVPCMSCHFCDRGKHTMCPRYPEFGFDPTGYAEYCRVRERHVRLGALELPPQVTFDEGCVIEPVSCILRALKVAGGSPGDTVLIIGSGFIGLVALQMARLFGAGIVMVTDIMDEKLRLAEELGADLAVHPGKQDVNETLVRENGGRKADLVFVSAPAIQAVSDALHHVERGGTIVQFGGSSPDQTTAINPYTFITRELTYLGTYSSSPADARSTLDLIARGRLHIKPLITDHFPLEQVQEAIEFKRETAASLKVVIHPGGDEGGGRGR
ncbi:MAG: zinc-binding dehydrogenase [Spirochaetota bacterium]